MLKDITIGQYYPQISFVHKLDPRTKLFITMIYLIGLFVSNNLVCFITCTLFLFCAIRFSRVPFRFMTRGLKSIVFLLVFSLLFTIFLTDGKTLIEMGPFTITHEGLNKAYMIALRLVYLVLGSSVLTLTTTPNDIADGLEKAFSPLNYIKVPVHEIAMMMSIAFRFIPVLTEEADRIMKAQQARGADFESEHLLKRVKNLIPLVVPLVVSAIKRALDLATAMEARCYKGGKGRTKMKPLKYKWRDAVGYIAGIAFLVIVICCRIYFS